MHLRDLHQLDRALCRSLKFRGNILCHSASKARSKVSSKQASRLQKGKASLAAASCGDEWDVGQQNGPFGCFCQH